MQLTKNFTLEELTRSATAEANGIGNEPNEQQTENLRKLCEFVLQPTRDAWGVPLRINSGYRCPELNRLVGGVVNSQHMQGEAADIHCTSLQNAICLAACIIDNAVMFDQLIIEQSPKSVWIHVSFAEGHNRMKVMTLFVK